MNDNAADRATSSRFGVISRIHMLLDTSRVRIIVVWPESTASGTSGRATAITRLASAARNKTKGKCFLHQEKGRRDSPTSDTLEKRTAKRCRLCRIAMYRAMSRGMHPNNRRKSGHNQSTIYLAHRRKQQVKSMQEG